ncbi:MAG: MBL fold metallo-hydrolase [Candidatus Margulisbacteria bacterium]|nr:MBL fold metallo-hydrolase [Candidatus Margulisiibacteriota bacterium]
MFQDILDPKRTNTWINLQKLNHHAQKDWIRKYIREIIQTLDKLPSEELESWNILGYICIDNNLYQEAERIYDELFKKTQKDRGNLGLPAYFRGIAHFLQGRFQDAYNDFKISRQSDLHGKKTNSPAIRALAYMEELVFPTREIIRSNQAKLVKDLNAPRNLDRVFGANTLRTIHKWNSASPLFSRGISQGGGYFLTLRNAQGHTKGIAIDPGYDFYYILRDLGLGITDIDAIIITHDHDDHTESVEGILSLLAKYNDHNEQKKTKVIDVFGSAGVLLKFHGLLSATDLFGNKEINFKLLVPGSEITEANGQSLLDKHGFTLSVKPAYHTECWTNQESAIGLVIHTNIPNPKNGGHLNIGITGDTRFEFGLGREYKESQVLLLNIGSIEKEEGKLLRQHLGMLGCINLLKEARIGKPLLAILTEFGEEFSGKRETISRIIENWAQPMSGSKNKDLKVIPADVNLELRLEDMHIRETDTNVFFPYNLIEVDETDTETLKYRFNG